MKRFAVFAGVLLAMALLLLLVQSEGRKTRKGEEKPGDKMTSIPLNSIYSTSIQEGLKVVNPGHANAAFENQMQELYRQSIKMGASNVFLARGDDIAAAVKATWEVFTRWRSVDEPASYDRRSKSGQYWLVAYLGVTGSTPPVLVVKSVEVSGQEIRLTLTNPGSRNPGYVTHNLHPYFFWVPLGKLETETYALHLVEAGAEASVLLRRVKVRAE